ncbi:fatty acid desaturase [Sorangium sp. So ce296]|uniref:fatty acid desaturase family protein n=1 Tax=Sorangium sp. So ce296 TaxID=3133296 RepID=UPI003F63A7EB
MMDTDCAPVSHHSRASHAPEQLDPKERLRRFGEAIDAIRARVEAELGEEDVDYVRRVDAFSRAMEIAGRALIHVSLDPVTFSLGVLALSVHKQIQALEIGHTVLHGTYDKIAGAEAFRAEGFSWDLPIDEESWRDNHQRHHSYTNIAGRDPDIHLGPVRLNEHTPYFALRHRGQLLFLLAVLAPSFWPLVNLQVTGVHDLYLGNGRGQRFDLLPDASWESVKLAHVKMLRKYGPYYLKNYVFYPLLAGPMAGKVLLGNWLAETLRDLYSTATLLCSHVGDDVQRYEEGTRAKSRGEWFAMQVESTHNFEVSLPISILCGGIDRQIEHHLFPRLPTNRLREIAPEVRAACEAHGVAYRSEPWGRRLKNVLCQIHALSFRDVVAAMA